jgi:phosphoribosyl 1,2-cyclic phosphodiesterase
MKLKILGSSSKGNSYILDNGKEVLVIEAGVRFSEVKKALDFKIDNIVGCFVSHEHSDHAGYANEFMKYVIDVYCSRGTQVKMNPYHRLRTTYAGRMLYIGDFKVLPFDVEHDAAEPQGFIINHPETGNILFLTDSYYSQYKFKNLNQIILEVNYDEDILNQRTNLHQSIKNRITTSHLSLQTAKELLLANDLSQVNNIVLIHLSDGNSNADYFKSEIEKLTGKTVTIADTGIEIEINKTPF